MTKFFKHLTTVELKQSGRVYVIIKSVVKQAK